MVTLDDRLRDWQQELLDLTNRNRLLSFAHSTSRPSTLRLSEPDPGTIYEALTQGKQLTLIGTPVPVEPEPLESEDDGAEQAIDAPPGSLAATNQPSFAPDVTGALQTIHQHTLPTADPIDSRSITEITQNDAAAERAIASSRKDVLRAVRRLQDRSIPHSRAGAPPPHDRHGASGALDPSETTRLGRGAEATDQPRAHALPPMPIDAIRSTFSPEKTNQVAHRLHDRARASELEQGINTLYAIVGRLKWQERPGDTWRYAPLVLVPVRIEERIRDSSYRLTTADDDPEFNQTLVERLRRDFGFNLTLEVTDETSLDDIFAAVRRTVADQAGWEVIEDVHLGIVQFHKIRMFKDLSDHAAIALQHPIVQALGLPDVLIAAPPEAIPTDAELDRAVAPDQSFAILDADASQLRAIQMAARGSHLIIHGPPGTGKSQTIANVVAEFVASGKSVLFVSEKAAAIEVVQRRLADRGLGELCLMLHSHKANKREIIAELGHRLEAGPDSAATPREELAHHRLASTREALNDYAEALHQPRGQLRESAFWGFGELAQLAAAPRLTTPPPGAGDTLTHAMLDEWDQLLRHAGRYEHVLQASDAHPWAWLRPQGLSLTERENLHQILTQLGPAIDRAQQRSCALADSLRLPSPGSLPEARQLCQLVATIPIDGDLLRTWFNPVHRTNARRLASEALHNATSAASGLERLSTIYGDRLLNLATPDAFAAYESGRLAQLVSRSFRAIRAQVRAATRDGQQRPAEQELASLREAASVNQHHQWLLDHRESLIHELGVAPADITPPRPDVWRQVAARIDAVDAIAARVPSGADLNSLLDVICLPGAGSRLTPQRQEAVTGLEAVDRLLRQLEPYGSSEPRTADGHSLTTATFDELRQWAAVRRDQFPSLSDWGQAQAARTALDERGLGATLSELLASGIPASEWSAAVRRRVITNWLDGVFADTPALHQFNGIEHEERIQLFRELDHACLAYAPARVRRANAQHNHDLAALQGGEAAVLRREAQKRKRHLPLRQLFARIPHLMLRLKPCLMMSPLSVAQFLPADLYHFDVVIFDEASQVRPFDAIGAIIRGSQLEVAGDNKQLPPTTFFDRVGEVTTDDDDEDLRALESILDALIAKNMPSTRLKWHYRSQHEDLIAFSNHHIYDRQLVTFPSPTAERSPVLGVHHVYVADGSYDGPPSAKVNWNEARRVVQLVMFHAQHRANQSLGVVALNMNQADEIERQLIEARKLNPSFESFFREDGQDPFFIKPLELVQGDERDVIIISIGFGKKNPHNPSETLSHHFGPINRDGGERRLNVLVTRARQQIILVSSIRASDIDPRRTQKQGPLLLKSYLDFAERGPMALDAQTTGGDRDYESPFEEAVGTALERLGYRVDRQIGVSRYRIDLAIVDPEHPGRYLLGIECDGMTYHRAKTARDRDRLRQANLEHLGWHIHRVWSTDWVRQPEVELDRIVARLAEIQRQDSGRPDPAAPNPLSAWVTAAESVELAPDQRDNDNLTESVPLPAPAATIQPYTVAELQATPGLDLATAPLLDLVETVELCVDIEGPVHWDVVGRRVANAWGRQRIKGTSESLIYRALETAVTMGRVRRRGEFLWPAADVEPKPRGLLPDGKPRKIDHISDEELTAGMLQAVRQGLSLTDEELILATRGIFGYRRTGKDINDRLQQIATAAVASGKLVQNGGLYRLPR